MFRQATLKFGTDHGIIAATCILFSLSAIDSALTLWGLTLEVVNEANPLMDLLIAKSPFMFILIKLLVPLAIGAYLWRSRQKDPLLVALALVISIAIYIVVTGFHVYWLVLFDII